MRQTIEVLFNEATGRWDFWYPETKQWGEFPFKDQADAEAHKRTVDFEARNDGPPEPKTPR